MTDLKLPNDVWAKRGKGKRVIEQLAKLQSSGERSPVNKNLYLQNQRSRNLIVFLILTGITVVLSGVTLVSYQLVRGLILDGLKQKALVEVQQGRNDIDRWLASRKAEINTLTGTPSVRSLDWNIASPHLQAEIKRLSEFFVLLVAKPDGSYFTAASNSIKANVSDRSFFKQAIAGNIYASDPFISRSTGIRSVAITAPIRDGAKVNSQIIGVVVGNIRLERINEVVSKLQYGSNSYAFALNSEGQGIVHPDLNLIGTMEKPKPSLIKATDRNLQQIAQRMVSKTSGVELTQLDGSWKYVAYTPLNEASWSIALVIPQENIESQLGYLNLLAAIAATFFVIALLGAIWIIKLFNQTQAQVQLLGEQSQELNQALDELKQTHIHLVQSEKMSSLGQMVAGIAHEINNPVNFIYGNLPHVTRYVGDLTQLLNYYKGALPELTAEIAEFEAEIDLDFINEDLPQMLGSMKLGAERIRNIIVSLRNFSRLDESERKAVDLHEGIDNTLLLLQHRIKNGIKVVKHYDDLPLVECYPSQINQVFMNLLSNAIDALEDAPRSPKQITISTNLIEVDNTKIVRVVIADNGTGIPAEVQAKIFDPFFTTKPVGKGTGLGLAISYQIIVDKHQGHLYIQDSAGGGAEFIVEVPVQFEVESSKD